MAAREPQLSVTQGGQYAPDRRYGNRGSEKVFLKTGTSKTGAGPDPMTKEKKLKDFKMPEHLAEKERLQAMKAGLRTGQVKSSYWGRSLYRNTAPRNTDTNPSNYVKAGYGALLAEEDFKQSKADANEQYVSDFYHWLRGREGTSNQALIANGVTSPDDIKRIQKIVRDTPLYQAYDGDLFRLPGVQDHLDTYIDRRAEFEQKIAQLILRGPHDFQSAWFYYKYVVRGVCAPPDEQLKFLQSYKPAAPGAGPSTGAPEHVEELTDDNLPATSGVAENDRRRRKELKRQAKEQERQALEQERQTLEQERQLKEQQKRSKEESKARKAAAEQARREAFERSIVRLIQEGYAKEREAAPSTAMIPAPRPEVDVGKLIEERHAAYEKTTENIHKHYAKLLADMQKQSQEAILAERARLSQLPALTEQPQLAEIIRAEMLNAPNPQIAGLLTHIQQLEQSMLTGQSGQQLELAAIGQKLRELEQREKETAGLLEYKQQDAATRQLLLDMSSELKAEIAAAKAQPSQTPLLLEHQQRMIEALDTRLTQLNASYVGTVAQVSQNAEDAVARALRRLPTPEAINAAVQQALLTYKPEDTGALEIIRVQMLGVQTRMTELQDLISKLGATPSLQLEWSGYQEQMNRTMQQLQRDVKTETSKNLSQLVVFSQTMDSISERVNQSQQALTRVTETLSKQIQQANQLALTYAQDYAEEVKTSVARKLSMLPNEALVRSLETTIRRMSEQQLLLTNAVTSKASVTDIEALRQELERHQRASEGIQLALTHKTNAAMQTAERAEKTAQHAAMTPNIPPLPRLMGPKYTQSPPRTASPQRQASPHRSESPERLPPIEPVSGSSLIDDQVQSILSAPPPSPKPGPPPPKGIFPKGQFADLFTMSVPPSNFWAFMKRELGKDITMHYFDKDRQTSVIPFIEAAIRDGKPWDTELRRLYELGQTAEGTLAARSSEYQMSGQGPDAPEAPGLGVDQATQEDIEELESRSIAQATRALSALSDYPEKWQNSEEAVGTIIRNASALLHEGWAEMKTIDRYRKIAWLGEELFSGLGAENPAEAVRRAKLASEKPAMRKTLKGKSAAKAYEEMQKFTKIDFSKSSPVARNIQKAWELIVKASELKFRAQTWTTEEHEAIGKHAKRTGHLELASGITDD